MKKKILISTLIVIMILSMSLMIFAGCKPKPFEKSHVGDFAIPEAAIGADGNDLDDSAVNGGITPINSKMSAFEMLEVGMKNFYNAKYTVLEYNGGVNMELLKMRVNQVVQSTKIRDGIGDADGNNANGATYFADNKSHSTFAKIYEKLIIRPDEFKRKAADSGISYKEHGKKVPERLGRWEVKSWKAVDNYDTLNELVTKNHNNPTILWMYDLKEEYVVDKFDVVYDSESKTYRFALEFEPEKSTVEYLQVMKAQLEGNANMPVDGLQFNQLILEVVMWENGMIRSINVNEAYQMKMKVPILGYLDSVVNLKATQLFSYNSNEEGYKIADHLNAF